MEASDSTRCSCCGITSCLKSLRVSESSKPLTNMEQVGDDNGKHVPMVIPSIIQIDDDEKETGTTNISMPAINFSQVEESPAPPAPVPVSNSLLGGDLLKAAMPPPTSTTVRKAKFQVQPGMSMVKWMKLQESKQRPPTRRKIPLSEIRSHNKESDCWMVIRNCVYDVTEYIPYHPGGIPELMKGAGKDATSLFNEVHRWVNFDSILRSCLQGYMLVEPGESFDESEEAAGGASLGKSLVTTKRIVPQTTFSQNDSLLFFQVDTMADDELSEDNWSVSLLNRERFLLKVILKPPDLWMAHLKLVQRISDDTLRVNFQNSFRKAVITFKKPSLTPWNGFGSPLDGNNQLMDSRNVFIDDFATATIVQKENVTPDVILIGIKPNSSTILHVPVGFHLKLRLPDNPDLSRKYTPVKKSLVDANPVANDDTTIHFMIKIYPNGKLTKPLGLTSPGSAVEMGAVAGKYDPSFIRNCDTLTLFAGGSGITPFIRILQFIQSRSASYPITRVILIFFNHTAEDIIWREQFVDLTNKWERFHFSPVISSGVKDWSGLVGRVNDSTLFETALQHAFGIGDVKPLKNQIGRFKAMICGSSGFNEACVTMLRNQSVVDVTATEEDTFVF